MKKLLLALFGLCLLLALGLLALGSLQEPPPGSLDRKLSEVLPAHGPMGWRGKDLPLGDTESLEEQSREVLAFDDHVYREYSRFGQQFSVYMAYWKPGSMPPRLVNNHNPDVCWINAGWSCTQRERAVVKANAPGLPPGEWGVYSKGTGKINVVFWHLVDGEPYVYERLNPVQKAEMIVGNILHHGTQQRREQLFIRISSNQPIEKLWENAFFQEVLQGIFSLPPAQRGS